MGLDRILDGQFVEIELTADGVELLLGRLEEPDPGEPLRTAAGLVHLLEIEIAGPSHTVLVQGHVDDHA
jgi:hypothetical protein